MPTGPPGPAEPAAGVRAVIEQELGASPDELFAAFDDDPLAAASVGQVYAFINYNIQEQFLGGDEVPKYEGIIASNCASNGANHSRPDAFWAGSHPMCQAAMTR